MFTRTATQSKVAYSRILKVKDEEFIILDNFAKIWDPSLYSFNEILANLNSFCVKFINETSLDLF